MRGKWAKQGKKWASSISTTLRMRDFFDHYCGFQKTRKDIEKLSKTKKMQDAPSNEKIDY